MNNTIKKAFSKIFLILCLSVFGLNSYACDTSPVLTSSNVVNIGGGFYTFDLDVCLGSAGSEDGFDVTMGCGLNITATSSATLNNGGSIANASIAGGVLTYTYPGFPGTWWEVNDFIAGPCFLITLTVDGNPENCDATVTGINDDCGIFTTSWTTTVPGPPLPCIVDYSITAPNTQAGNTTGGGDNCASRLGDDNIIEVIIPCDETWTFSLCGNSAWDTYLYLSNTCCGPDIANNDDACGVQSEITQFLTAGTYYITIEGFSSTSNGAYVLDVSSANPCNIPCTYTIDAGPSVTICEGDSTILAGVSGGGVISTTWSSAGDGTFINANSLTGTYIPGASDILAGSVILTITTDDPGVPCTIEIDTMIVTINPTEDPTFNYSAASYCQADVDPLANITGTLGGTFTSTPAGLNINAATGLIDLSASTAGTYGVLYTTPGICVDTLTVFVTVVADEDATFNYPFASYCQGDVDPLANIIGTPGGTFTSSPAGLVINPASGLIDLSASALATYGILYTTPGAMCSDTLTFFVSVVSSEDATFNYTAASYCQSDIDPTANIAGTPAGIFTSTPVGLNINAATGLIDLSASAAGTYGILYTTPTPACVDTLTVFVTVVADEVATFNYSAASYCQSDIDPPVNLTGTPGGTFTSTPVGLNINAATGLIDASASTAGTYGVLYTTPGAMCSDTLTVFVTIIDNEIATFNYSAVAYCQDDVDPLANITGTLGGTFTSTPVGLNINPATSLIDLSASTPGTYGVLYTTPSANCDDTLTVFVTVVANDDATFNYSAAAYCQGDVDPAANITGTPGGTFTSTPAGLNINAATGLIDLSASTAGAYGVLYTTSGALCNDTLTVFVTVNADETAAFTYPSGAYCQGDPDPVPNITGTIGGTFSSSPAGLIFTAGTGEIDLSVSTPGTYGLLYTTPGATCNDTITFFITVNADEDATFNYSSASYCVDAVNPTPTISGTPGGTFTSTPAGLNLNAGTGLIDIATSTPGTYGVFYTTSASACRDTLTVFVTVNGLPIVVANTNDDTICFGEPVILTGTGANSYLWDNNVFDGASFNPISSNTYTVTGTDLNGCSSTDQITVYVYSLPVISLGDDTTLCEDTFMIAPSGTYSTYLWQDGSTNPSYLVTSEGYYSVTVTDAQGCSGSADVVYIKDCLYTIWIPNSFSPDGDGHNDFFNIQGEYIESFTLSIFDRWGENLFNTSSMSMGWDGTFKGKIVANGSYVYRVDYTYYNKQNLIRKQRTGAISVLR